MLIEDRAICLDSITPSRSQRQQRPQPPSNMAFYADHPYALIPTPAFQNSQNEKETSEPDMFVRVASEMALVHNMAIRGLNSIYLQAPHVPAAESRAFLRYVLAWHDLLHVHHSGEEADLFPAIEAMAGQAGLMDGNVSQHEEFRDGLAAFKAYVDACASGREQLDGARLVALIDGFGGPLARHLGDEIPSILGLRLFGADKMAGLEQKFAEEGEKNMVSRPPPSRRLTAMPGLLVVR
ncbi:hypothetical protein CTA2_3366 [Colletotrichum tanaceti]|uniref:Hemerythrin-like domain-containing protein n=1 Tax=Colletotrichum tanaceti TaxID=1306861 RepID=A0A4U6XNY3_9PEZI|nr:hypothetical protein CTA2_3366 [Colletotrichum tanaceti]TKW57452.1 hypothetical protein CTA1_8515 [Colletotrichum tanaceti]